jgi:hypothetical protein
LPIYYDPAADVESSLFIRVAVLREQVGTLFAASGTVRRPGEEWASRSQLGRLTSVTVILECGNEDSSLRSIRRKRAYGGGHLYASRLGGIAMTKIGSVR